MEAGAALLEGTAVLAGRAAAACCLPSVLVAVDPGWAPEFSEERVLLQRLLLHETTVTPPSSPATEVCTTQLL